MDNFEALQSGAHFMDEQVSTTPRENNESNTTRASRLSVQITPSPEAEDNLQLYGQDWTRFHEPF